MKQSKFFTKTQKKAPKDEESANAQLLIRAGFIAKEMAGVYSFLPLGFRVLKKIENIIRKEIELVSGQEVLMPSLCPESSWEKTKRASMDILFHLESSDRAKYVLNPTHEETLTPLVKKFVSSYRDLPFYVFQFQTKFRNEPRAKSGLLRGREFIMKDLYSFHADRADLEKYYETVKEAYFRIYEKVGLKKHTFLTFASGGAFSKYSHEFQTVCRAGEDTIHLCEKCSLAVNEEIIKEQEVCPGCLNKNLVVKKAVEVGNIFKLGTRFSQSFNLQYKDKKSAEHFVEMGCYGLGLGRLMGVLAELFHDENGLLWPKSVAPFSAHLIAVGEGQKVFAAAEKLYHQLQKQGVEVLYDDRAASAGEKFADADLIGIPLRLIVSEKTLTKKSAEVKKRSEDKTKLVSLQKLCAQFKDYVQ